VRRRGITFVFFVACAAAGLLSAALLATSPDATAQEGTTVTTGTTTTAPPPPPPPPPPTTTTTPTVPRPTTIPAGVTVASQVLVGGLSPAEATTVVKAFFARPLIIRIGKRTFRVTPKQLGASAYVGDAVKRARTTLPGRNVQLKISAPQPPIQRYVRLLAERFDRAAVNSRLLLRGSKPFVTKHQDGRRLRQLVGAREILRSLKAHLRGPLPLVLEPVRASVTRRSIGDVIVIRRGANRLELYDGMKLRRSFGVATGESRYPTPLGRFEIIVKWRNPWWYPPASEWAKDAKPIPPGPGNPLGTRWMGISSPAVGIHGTPDSASIGYSVSHGCIRMLIPDVEWLFQQVEIGTPVFIVP
jgi:lipoprotein-anchoring transpeptidase ErfK/SrfK